MATSADGLWRWLGLLFLALSFGFLVWGQTVLREHLKGTAFLAYWGCCFLFTLAAIVIALVDLRATRRRAQREHQDLVRRTLNELDQESGDKSRE